MIPIIRILGTILAGLLGLAFGSFLNVCLSRWPAGESVVKPRSHCRSCGRTLAWWENIPVFSWVALRGRCRTCHTKISWRYPLVELAIGGLCAYVAAQPFPDYPSSDSFAVLVLYTIASRLLAMLFLWMLICLAILDAENLWLPNFLTGTGAVIGFLKCAADPFVLLLLTAKTGLPLTEEFEHARFGLWTPALERIVAVFAAAAIILVIRWTYWLFRKREGIGLGDAKLMAMLGAWLGIAGAALSLALGVLLGTLFSLVVLAVPALRRESDSWRLSKLPLGTFLCIGGIISALWGGPLIAAYLHMVGVQ